MKPYYEDMFQNKLKNFQLSLFCSFAQFSPHSHFISERGDTLNFYVFLDSFFF